MFFAIKCSVFAPKQVFRIFSDLSVVVLDDLQQGGLQQHVDPLRREQVLRLAQLAQAEQQRLRQHQEGRFRSEARALLLLHTQSQLLQLNMRFDHKKNIELSHV